MIDLAIWKLIGLGSSLYLRYLIIKHFFPPKKEIKSKVALDFEVDAVVLWSIVCWTKIYVKESSLGENNRIMK